MKKQNGKIGKVIATALSLPFAFGAVGCGGGDTSASTDNANKTIIEVRNFGGGVGRQWLDNAFERFAELKKDVSYEPGKKGLALEVDNSVGSGAHQGLHTSTFNIVMTQAQYASVFGELQKGAYLDITDIVSEETLEEYGENVTIESKLDENYRDAMKGNDGKYYMLPHYEYHPSPSYDVTLFEQEGFYLSDGNGGEEYECELTGETYYFISEDYKTKSVGNDGKRGTSDDGMPTTLNELVAMCDYMKEIGNVTPFSVAGNHVNYANYLLEALWTALAGYDARVSVMSFKGEVECVKMNEQKSDFLYENEEVWAGTGIKVPKTEKVQVTEATGYNAVNQAARYYAFAFMELAHQRGWFYHKYKQSNYTHQVAMREFVLNGEGNIPKIGAHLEASYWYNEMEGYNIMSQWKQRKGLSADAEDKKIALWHMPTSYGNDVVTGETNAREETIMNNCTAFVFLNANMADNPDKAGVLQACKEFLKFISTEDELRAFTSTTGVTKAMYDYTIDEEVMKELSHFQKTVVNLRANTRVVQQYSVNKTYKNNTDKLTSTIGSPLFNPYFTGVQYTCPIEAYDDGYTTAECFAQTGYTESRWLSGVYTTEE